MYWYGWFSDVESKLREVFDDLLGPVYKTKQSKWESHVLVCSLGLLKHSLLWSFISVWKVSKILNKRNFYVDIYP